MEKKFSELSATELNNQLGERGTPEQRKQIFHIHGLLREGAALLEAYEKE